MKRLVRLYPRAWRARYEEETVTLLDQQHASLKGSVDLVRGAVDAHRHPHFVTGRRPSMAARLRASASAVFCAYVGFALAYGFLQKLADPQAPFDAVAAAHTPVGLAFTAIVVGFAVALLAILVGGAPIGYAVVTQAIAARRRDILSLCAVPLVALATLTGWTLLVARVPVPAGQGASVPSPLAVALVLSWVGLCGLAVSASAAAIVRAIARSEIGVSLWRFALAPATVAAVSMAVALAATVAWGASVRAYAPSLFERNLGGAWFGVVVVVMAVATGSASVALKRGYAACATP